MKGHSLRHKLNFLKCFYCVIVFYFLKSFVRNTLLYVQILFKTNNSQSVFRLKLPSLRVSHESVKTIYFVQYPRLKSVFV